MRQVVNARPSGTRRGDGAALQARDRDQWLRFVSAQEAAKQIPGARLVGFQSPLAHYAVFQAPNVLKDEVAAFFKEIGNE